MFADIPDRATEAKTVMITTTTNISMSVNPRRFLRIFRSCTFLRSDAVIFIESSSRGARGARGDLNRK